ncbi:sensor histidine kinase [Gracilibacillus kekensis]|uniref:histidine kinase n=1 Tax=Gracilibacillus kekensis TaxID=1027249 RepID=A0A1M7QI08_9BACI|nr:sensor histidine kinase [Gracilibacillus kekensis]SHN30401.1 Histidine kinase-, DNA gyrase B-, and HSP90-like ATPase [Gracilibacillus kekensis]
MIKIRTKLLIYFVAILVLVVILFFVREQSAQQIVELHDESSEYYFLLNEITNTTDQTYQSLQIYVHEPIEENLNYYQEDKAELAGLQKQYDEVAEDSVSKQNYLNLIKSFVEHSDQTVYGVDQDDVEQYSFSLNEADNTATYIHEKTLELINQKLTQYQNLIALEDQRVQDTKNMGTAIFISIIILSILYALWFSNGITKVIDRLTSAAREISKGNYAGEDVVVSQKDELKILTDTFNQMKRNILQSVSDIEEKARLAQLLKEMELKSLQNQINPHFLFNTLNTISKTSYIEGAERTSDLISSVSALLRYNIGDLERDTTLKDEVMIVNEYFFIQKTRFGDRVTFHQEIEEDCLSVAIPCLTLQPIIENAFMHGIEEMAEGAEITLRIYREQDDVYIEIVDNGVGMEQQAIDRLMNDENESTQKGNKGHSTGIGMRNVIDRLNLFNKDAQISIFSQMGKGTKVMIKLPKGETP